MLRLIFWMLLARVRFLLFNDTWSQWWYLVSCMTILFINLQVTRSDIRLHIKWVVRLVIAYGHYSSSGVCVGMYGLTYSLYRLCKPVTIAILFRSTNTLFKIVSAFLWHKYELNMNMSMWTDNDTHQSHQRTTGLRRQVSHWWSSG